MHIIFLMAICGGRFILAEFFTVGGPSQLDQKAKWLHHTSYQILAAIEVDNSSTLHLGSVFILAQSDQSITSASVTTVVKEPRIAACEHFVATYVIYRNLEKLNRINQEKCRETFFPSFKKVERDISDPSEMWYMLQLVVLSNGPAIGIRSEHLVQ